jgi:hypothetical protein
MSVLYHLLQSIVGVECPAQIPSESAYRTDTFPRDPTHQTAERPSALRIHKNAVVTSLTVRGNSSTLISEHVVFGIACALQSTLEHTVWIVDSKKSEK